METSSCIAVSLRKKLSRVLDGMNLVRSMINRYKLAFRLKKVKSAMDLIQIL
jgi:hypothetical protein